MARFGGFPAPFKRHKSTSQFAPVFVPEVRPEGFEKAAKGTMQPPRMNDTELEYSNVLEARKMAREIDWYIFEGVKLRLSDNTFYTADFFVMLHDGTLQVHEVKGTTKKENSKSIKVEKPWIEEDASVKIKIAATMFPLQFFVCFKSKVEGWILRPVGRVK